MAYSRYGYGTDPAQYAMGQQERQDEQFRNLINMMIALSKYKTEQGQYSQEWQNKLSEQAAARSIEERRTAAYEKSVEPQPKAPTEWGSKWAVAKEHFGDDPQKMAEWILGIKQSETPEKYPSGPVAQAQKTFGITPEEWNSASNKQKSDWMNELQLRTRPKEPKEPKTIPLHDLPQYRQGQFIDKAVTDLEGERLRLMSILKTAKKKDAKDINWRIGNIDLGLNKLRFSRAKISGTNKPLDEREWAKIVAVGSDVNKVQTEREFWSDRFPTISAKNVPDNTEYKLVGGRKTVKLGGVVYEVIE